MQVAGVPMIVSATWCDVLVLRVAVRLVLVSVGVGVSRVSSAAERTPSDV